MGKKILKIGLAVVGVAVAFVPGVGQAVAGAMTALFSGTAVGAGGTFLAASIAGTITSGLAVAGVVTGLSMGAKALGLGPKPPKQSPASQDRLRASLDPRAYRKIVFGHTAAATDVGYQEFTGTDQEYLNTILVLASHAVHSIEQVFFDEKLAWSGSGIGSDFTGYLSVTDIEAGTTGNAFTITGSSSWTSSSSRLVGCSYLWLRYKLTGNSKKAESPFATSVSSRITVRVKGAKLYDPRLDTTVGGSGSHRADDQTTWAWVSDDVGRNPALQLLWYLLGWRIQNPADSSWKLAVGLGLPVARIDLDSFIAAANLCDEPVTLDGGGTEPRYRSDGVFSEGDDPQLVFENLLAAMNGSLRDAGGKLALDVLHNDLASPVIDLTEADVIGEFTWMQTPAVDQEFNVVRGRYVDSSDEGLYQFADYPEVSLTSEDGIERPRGFDLPMVQSASQAQRLAKQFLQRAQYPGTFAADFLASAWRCQVGSVVTLTFPALGFEEKLFRVVEHSIQFTGTCAMVLREENAAIYAWDAEESAPVTAAAPISYDPLNDPVVQAIRVFDPVLIRSTEPSNPRDTSNVYQRLLSAEDVGASVTIEVARHDWAYPDGNAAVTRELGTVTGLSFSTRYWVYFDDATLADGSPTYYATTTYETAINSPSNPGRHLVGTVRTPADGGTGTNEVDIRIAEASVMNANDRNNQTPDAGGSITSVTKFLDHADARVSYEATFTFPYNADPNHKNNVDGFAIGYIGRDSSGAYTMLGVNTAAEHWRVVYLPMGDASYTLPFLQQVDPTKYYTIGYAPFRLVDPATNPDRYVIGPITQHGPFRPAATQAITGSGLTVGGQTASDVGTGTSRGLAVINSNNNINTGVKIGGDSGQVASNVSDAATRALAAITSGNKAATSVVETISLTSETVTHLFAGSTSSTEIALDGGSYGTYVSVASSSFTVQEGGADVLFLGLVSVRFGITATDSNLQFTATARITFDGVNSNTFEVTQTVYAAGRNTTVPIVISHLFEGVAAGSRTFTLAIKVDDPSGSGDYAETRGVRAVQIMELKR